MSVCAGRVGALALFMRKRHNGVKSTGEWKCSPRRNKPSWDAVCSAQAAPSPPGSAVTLSPSILLLQGGALGCSGIHSPVLKEIRK